MSALSAWLSSWLSSWPDGGSAVALTWEAIAGGLGAAVVGLAAILWGRVSGDLSRVAESLGEVAKMVHGHGIRLDHIERDTTGKR